MNAPTKAPATKVTYVYLSPKAAALPTLKEDIKLALAFMIKVRDSGNRDGRQEFQLKDVCHVIDHLSTLLGSVAVVSKRKGKNVIPAALMTEINRIHRTYGVTLPEDKGHMLVRFKEQDNAEWLEIEEGLRYRALDALLLRHHYLKLLMTDVSWKTKLEVIYDNDYALPEQGTYAVSVLTEFFAKANP